MELGGDSGALGALKVSGAEGNARSGGHVGSGGEVFGSGHVSSIGLIHGRMMRAREDWTDV